MTTVLKNIYFKNYSIYKKTPPTRGRVLKTQMMKKN